MGVRPALPDSSRREGEFADIPLARMRETWQREYPELAGSWSGAGFDADVDAETRGAGGAS